MAAVTSSQASFLVGMSCHTWKNPTWGAHSTQRAESCFKVIKMKAKSTFSVLEIVKYVIDQHAHGKRAWELQTVQLRAKQEKTVAHANVL